MAEDEHEKADAGVAMADKCIAKLGDPAMQAAFFDRLVAGFSSQALGRSAGA